MHTPTMQAPSSYDFAIGHFKHSPNLGSSFCAQCQKMDAPSGTPVSITNSKEQEKYLDLAFRTQAQVDFLRAYCMIGDRRLIANAIEEGIDVNSKTKDGRTAMHLCARIGNVHVLKFLIVKCGGNANARDSGGFTPAHYACRYGRLNVVKMLIEKELANFQNRSYLTREIPYDCAKYNGHKDIVDYLWELSKRQVRHMQGVYSPKKKRSNQDESDSDNEGYQVVA